MLFELAPQEHPEESQLFDWFRIKIKGVNIRFRHDIKNIHYRWVQAVSTTKKKQVMENITLKLMFDCETCLKIFTLCVKRDGGGAYSKRKY